MVKNGCDQFGHGTLKLTLSRNGVDEIADFLHASTNAGRLKVDSIIFIVCLVKDGSGFLVHESLRHVS